MKLLFDENISYRVVGELGDSFAGSNHLIPLGLQTASDREVWDFAKRGGFCIVTKDLDFLAYSTMEGAPPKVIHLAIGNCTTVEIVGLLRDHQSELEAFLASPDESYLELT
ncbi:MAG: DUF5615 family PIN-like protein [Verrucomicrobiota bacterium]